MPQITPPAPPRKQPLFIDSDLPSVPQSKPEPLPTPAVLESKPTPPTIIPAEEPKILAVLPEKLVSPPENLPEPINTAPMHETPIIAPALKTDHQLPAPEPILQIAAPEELHPEALTTQPTILKPEIPLATQPTIAKTAPTVSFFADHQIIAKPQPTIIPQLPPQDLIPLASNPDLPEQPAPELTPETPPTLFSIADKFDPHIPTTEDIQHAVETAESQHLVSGGQVIPLGEPIAPETKPGNDSPMQQTMYGLISVAIMVTLIGLGAFVIIRISSGV